MEKLKAFIKNNWLWLILITIILIIGIVLLTVSYTHLDVYKRQEKTNEEELER